MRRGRAQGSEDIEPGGVLHSRRCVVVRWQKGTPGIERGGAQRDGLASAQLIEATALPFTGALPSWRDRFGSAGRV